ncbi:MAG: tetratricopeptide repeat protein [Acidobacteriota bacterium]|nr:tetratricopeptide repeat protein [Acidobacteriota bacterium]
MSAGKAQQRQKPPTTTTPSKSIPASPVFGNGSIYVEVYPAAGSVFVGRPNVEIRQGSFGDAPVISMPEEIGQNEWRFRGLQVGAGYEIVVQANGYETQRQYVLLTGNNNSTALVKVYLMPNGRAVGVFPAPAGNFVLAPRAQHEVDQGVKDLKSSKTTSARKHLEKALNMAPGNPWVIYLMGLSYFKDHDTDKAVPYFERSLSIDPSELPPRLALATVRFQQGDYSAAIDLLKDAPGNVSGAWEAQWILASSYLRMKNYKQARRHAEESLKANKKAARGVRLVLGEALAGLGQLQQAIKQLETFLKENSHDPEKDRVRAMLERLRHPAPASPEPAVASSEQAAASEPEKLDGEDESEERFRAGTRADNRTTPRTAVVSPTPPPAIPRNENWAPPDVEVLKPRIISNATCPLPSLLKRAGQFTSSWVKDLQEFTATEEYESVEIGNHGKVAKPFEKRFEYLVFIRKPRPNLFSVEEVRNPDMNLSEMGSPVVALGSPALALVFHPVFAHDYVWSCDGMGEWKGKPAWIVRFTQRADRPTTSLQSFENRDTFHLLPLKGIAWLSEKGDHVVHLETDLVNPMPLIHLDRQHFSIDYEQVTFQSHPVTLWLPRSTDLYVTYYGHSYHNYASYSHFLLFWTGTEQVIGTVKLNNPKR